MALVFCILNGYVQAAYQLIPCSHKNVTWLYDVRFILGTIVFFVGMGINIHSDSILRSLRGKDSENSSDKGDLGERYKIPRGGMFNYVSGANYFGECVEWIGYAMLSWNVGAASFAFFTCANIFPRAIQHHKWYKKTFGEEYPANRKAIVPFLI